MAQSTPTSSSSSTSSLVSLAGTGGSGSLTEDDDPIFFLPAEESCAEKLVRRKRRRKSSKQKYQYDDDDDDDDDMSDCPTDEPFDDISIDTDDDDHDDHNDADVTKSPLPPIAIVTAAPRPVPTTPSPSRPGVEEEIWPHPPTIVPVETTTTSSIPSVIEQVSTPGPVSTPSVSPSTTLIPATALPVTTWNNIITVTLAPTIQSTEGRPATEEPDGTESSTGNTTSNVPTSTPAPNNDTTTMTTFTLDSFQLLVSFHNTTTGQENDDDHDHHLDNLTRLLTEYLHNGFTTFDFESIGGRATLFTLIVTWSTGEDSPTGIRGRRQQQQRDLQSIEAATAATSSKWVTVSSSATFFQPVPMATEVDTVHRALVMDWVKQLQLTQQSSVTVNDVKFDTDDKNSNDDGSPMPPSLRGGNDTRSMPVSTLVPIIVVIGSVSFLLVSIFVVRWNKTWSSTTGGEGKTSQMRMIHIAPIDEDDGHDDNNQRMMSGGNQTWDEDGRTEPNTPETIQERVSPTSAVSPSLAAQSIGGGKIIVPSPQLGHLTMETSSSDNDDDESSLSVWVGSSPERADKGMDSTDVDAIVNTDTATTTTTSIVASVTGRMHRMIPPPTVDDLLVDTREHEDYESEYDSDVHVNIMDWVIPANVDYYGESGVMNSQGSVSDEEHEVTPMNPLTQVTDLGKVDSVSEESDSRGDYYFRKYLREDMLSSDDDSYGVYGSAQIPESLLGAYSIPGVPTGDAAQFLPAGSNSSQSPQQPSVMGSVYNQREPIPRQHEEENDTTIAPPQPLTQAARNFWKAASKGQELNELGRTGSSTANTGKDGGVKSMMVGDL